jgi:hypothetical protein
MLVLRTRILNMINSTYKACAAVLYIRCDRVGKPSEGEWSNMDKYCQIDNNLLFNSLLIIVTVIIFSQVVCYCNPSSIINSLVSVYVQTPTQTRFPLYFCRNSNTFHFFTLQGNVYTYLLIL